MWISCTKTLTTTLVPYLADDPLEMAAKEAHILKKKEAILSLEKYLDLPVCVAFKDHRVIQGTLKGFDSNINMVLGDAVEKNRGLERRLGAAIVRGASVATVYPLEGTTEVETPFAS